MPYTATAPQSWTIITNSGAVSSSSATPNLNATATYGRPIPAVEAVSLILNVTANTGTGGANAAWVWLEMSPDGGTTWIPTERFTQVTTSTATHVLNFRGNGIGASEAAAQQSAVQSTSATIVQNTVLTQDQRIVWQLSTGQSLTFGLYAAVMPLGARSSA